MSNGHDSVADGRASERSMKRPRPKVRRGVPGLRRFYRNHKNVLRAHGWKGGRGADSGV